MVVLAAALAGFVGAVIGSSVSMSIRVRRVSDTGVSAQRDRTDAGQEAGSYAATDCEIDTLCCEDKSAAENSQEDRLEDFRRWLEEQERAANTVQAYCASMRGFFRSYGEVSQKNGMAWKQELQEAGMSPSTVNVRINAYNAYCTMAGDSGSRLRTLRIHQAPAVSNVISEREYQKLLDGLARDQNWRWYFGIKLLAVTGVRVSEFVRLRKSDFDRGYAEMWTKGKMRRIFIPKSLQREARQYYSTLRDDDHLFCRQDGKPITRRGVASMLHKFADRYGIDRDVMHPHSFRHLFALKFLQRKPDLSLLADVMGHSSVSTTAIYTRMTREQQSRTISRVVNW